MNQAATVVATTSENARQICSRGFEVEFCELDTSVCEHASELYWDWLRFFENDSGAKISQHPDHIIAELTSSEIERSRPAFSVMCRSESECIGLGILMPKTIGSREIAKTVPSWNLNGYRLAGNRFLGNGDDRVTQLLLEETADFVAKRGVSFLLVEDLEDHDPLWTALSNVDPRRARMYVPNGTQERFRIQFLENAADYWSKFSTSTRKKFRKRVRQFGNKKLVRVTQPDEVADFLEQAHHISARSWQASVLGVRVNNSESELRELLFLATQGSLRSYLLFLDDAPVAFEIASQYRGYYSAEEAGFDMGYSGKSPGQVLQLMLLEDLCEFDSPNWYDFGLGDADYKRMFANHESRSGNVWLVPSGIRHRLAAGSLSTAYRAECGMRSLLNKAGCWRTIRQSLRSGVWSSRASQQPGTGD